MRQKQALRIMLEGKSVFLTGPPGAGKTYVLNDFIRRAGNQGRNVAITASTGIAATHIGGTTIHSWSGLGVREVLSKSDRQRLMENERLANRYNAADVLVIDEVSMLHGHRLNMVNDMAKTMRQNDEPFGGLQVILVGDLFQLPPVNRSSENVDFIHLSTSWDELNPRICYLNEQHRQVNDGLLEILNAMRRGDVSAEHQLLIEERLNKQPEEREGITRLYAHNIDVESINQKYLAALDEETKVYSMQTKGAAAKIEQLTKSVLAPAELELKIGAEVMFVANNFGAGYVNGSRGRVLNFNDGLPVVELISGRKIKVEPYSWSLDEDGKTRAMVVQLPLRLAWAITIHKSQGMSLDAAQIDLGRSFTPGMGYVALSRVRSLEGVYLRGINNMAFRMHPEIFAFDDILRQSSERLAETVEDVYEEDIYEEGSNGSPGIDESLEDKLKEWRLERAQAENVPAYMIAHNSVLAEIATRLPRSEQKLKTIKGFGSKKFNRYGKEILLIIAEHIGQTGDSQESWGESDDKKLLKAFAERQSLHAVVKDLGREPQEIWQRLSDLRSKI